MFLIKAHSHNIHTDITLACAHHRKNPDVFKGTPITRRGTTSVSIKKGHSKVKCIMEAPPFYQDHRSRVCREWFLPFWELAMGQEIQTGLVTDSVYYNSMAGGFRVRGGFIGLNQTSSSRLKLIDTSSFVGVKPRSMLS